MKKLYIYLLLVGCILSACDSIKDLQPAFNMGEAVPQAAINAIKQEFPEATQIKFSTLEKDKLWESNFQFKVDRMSAIVNNTGKITETYKITNGVQLPDNALNYITTNFPSATIRNVCQQLAPNNTTVIGYKVIVTLTEGKDIAVIFDATGTLVMVASNDRPGPGGGSMGIGGPPKIYFIEQKDLPEAIKAYLSEKHQNYSLIKAAVSIQGGNKLYSVVITKDLTTFEYLFDEKGNILRSGTLGLTVPVYKLDYKPLSSKDLPQVIKEVLNLNFTEWTYENGFTFLQNGALQGYYILITSQKKQFAVQFDAKGENGRGFQVCGALGASSGKYDIKAIQPKDLPESITNFLSNRYQEFAYIQTSLITDKDKKIYWVAIVKENFVINYSFDDKGKVIGAFENPLKFSNGKLVAKYMQDSDITVVIKEYFNTYYKGWVFQAGLMHYVDSQLFSYVIVIRVSSEFYILSFDADGNFVAARKG
ncbi:PepSY-like domain-containing protein [Emticicia sp. BO119]|uniref:PepSY-like domain-containing protein n=1 Tax=Emticicia sp. BO119 TaxID=2757768 RepID=UPI0015EFDF09|nr:PepSY-like domain-containing protein [Emticicia sp. BO119]MBA4853179.1 PepSY-like domain-containing protein [Emticicia sp. BO119]